MSKTSETSQNEKNLKPSSGLASRESIIKAVQTPLGFFVLVVLIIEAIFGITANFSSGNDKTYLIVGMLVLIFLLVLIVAGMAIFRPVSLYGKPMTVTKQVLPTIPSSLDSKISETVRRPKILVAGGFQNDQLQQTVRQGFQILREAFPSFITVIEKPCVTADEFRVLLARNKFDIVQLTADVRQDGSIDFLQDTIPGDGLVQLLELSNTQLLVLASCNSVPLAAKMATKINMVASAGTLQSAAFCKWERVFYRLLSQGIPLSKAFAVATDSVNGIPIVMIMKQDVTFIKDA